MNVDQLQQAERIFDDIVDLPHADRLIQLEKLCGSDLSLRILIERLMASDDSGGFGFPAAPAARLLSLDNSAPTRIANYEILRPIGEGGMAVVYEARQHNPSRTVALKLLRSALPTGESLRRFQFEVETLAQLQHPGIAHVYEAGSARIGSNEFAVSQPYFAMELIRGCSLTEFATRNRLNLGQRLELMAKVCDAVEHAHHKGVIHRDLKPSNILVDDSGQPKLLDFGVARAIHVNPQSTLQATETGQWLGTPAYMGPEQISGDYRRIDARSDIYSLGVVLYELLSGQLPHALKGLSASETIRRLSESEAPMLGSINRSFRGDIETIVITAMAREQVRRYQSAGEFSRDIRHFLAGEPIDAKRGSTWYVLRKTLRRYRLPVGIASTFLLILTTSAVALSWMYGRQAALLKEVQQGYSLADKRFNQVRELAHTFMYDMHDEIAELPGSTEARQLLVTEALQYLDTLAVDAGEDQTLLLELASGYQRLADVQGSNRGPNLGDVTGQFQSNQKAFEIIRPQYEQNPEDRNLKERLATAYQRLAECQYTTQKSDLTLEYHRSALKHWQELFADDTESLYFQKRVASSLVELWGKPFASVNPKDALLQLRRGKELIEGVLDADPTDREARQVLMACHEHLGMWQGGVYVQSLGDREGAMAEYLTALSLAEELAAESPDNFEAQRDILTCCNRIVDILQVQKQYEESFAYLDRSIAIAERLVAADPSDARALADTAAFYEQKGHTLQKLGRRDEAVELYRSALRLNDTLRQFDPSNSSRVGRAAMLCFTLAGVFESTQQWREVVVYGQKALTQWEQLDALQPPNPRTYRKVLNTTADLLITAQEALGDRSGAIQTHRRLLHDFETQLVRYPGHDDCIQSTSDACRKLAEYLNLCANRDSTDPRERESWLAESQSLLNRAANLVTATPESGHTVSPHDS